MSQDSNEELTIKSAPNKTPKSLRKSSGVSFDRAVTEISTRVSSRGRTQSCTSGGHVLQCYSLEDDSEQMCLMEGRSARSQSSVSYQSAFYKAARSFTPPLPRAISNTISKVTGSRDQSRSPTSKRRRFFSRHTSDPDAVSTKTTTNNSSPLSSPSSKVGVGVVVTSGRHITSRR